MDERGTKYGVPDFCRGLSVQEQGRSRTEYGPYGGAGLHLGPGSTRSRAVSAEPRPLSFLPKP